MISIVMPNYNKEDFVAEAINSILDKLIQIGN